MYQVLFVDDDKAIGFIVSKFSCWENSEFVLKRQVNSGAEALQYLETEEYDLVITDIRMPVMDGLELIREIRKRNLKVAVILSSTYSDFQYAREGMRLGALDYISKPLTEKKLTEEFEYIKKYLQEQKTKAQKLPKLIDKESMDPLFEFILHNSPNLVDYADEIVGKVDRQAQHDLQREQKILQEIAVSICQRFSDTYPWIKNLFLPELEFSEDSFAQEFVQSIRHMGELADKFQLAVSDSRTFQICKLLFLNIEEPKVADLIAERLELNKDYLGVVFKNSTGIGFNKYITMIKMEYAKALLKDSNLKIYEISQRCGYSTIDYFTRLFKQSTGMTPLQFRKK